MIKTCFFKLCVFNKSLEVGTGVKTNSNAQTETSNLAVYPYPSQEFQRKGYYFRDQKIWQLS
jgi:hypothetical protein